MKKIFTFFWTVSFVLMVGSGPGWAETAAKKKEPLWELGVFNSAMSFPHYRGSDEQMYYLLAIPYFIYRGEIFKADRDGLKGIFYKSDRMESSISLSGYPPVNGDTDARAGMPDLGALFGIGPELRLYVNHRKAINPLYISTSVHSVSSIDYDSGWRIAYEGLQYRAHIIYRNNTLIKKKGSFFGINTGVYYADSGLNSYLYDVEQEYVRPNRPFYRSDRGHSGHSVHSYLIYKLTDVFSLGFFGRWDNVRHATYNDSPLVKKADTYTGGVSLIWKIMESKKLVEAD